MVQAIDDANDNKAARSVYRRLYLSLSHFTIHAGGGTLLRHVSPQGKLRKRSAKAWTRRAPARVIDAAVGALAADLAQHAGRPDARLVRYASKHEARTIMPMVVMAFNGAVSSSSPFARRRLVETARVAKEVYVYLWNGPALADPIPSGWRSSRSGSRRSWRATTRRSRRGRSIRSSSMSPTCWPASFPDPERPPLIRRDHPWPTPP